MCLTMFEVKDSGLIAVYQRCRFFSPWVTTLVKEDVSPWLSVISGPITFSRCCAVLGQKVFVLCPPPPPSWHARACWKWNFMGLQEEAERKKGVLRRQERALIPHCRCKFSPNKQAKRGRRQHFQDEKLWDCVIKLQVCSGLLPYLPSLPPSPICFHDETFQAGINVSEGDFCRFNGSIVPCASQEKMDFAFVSLGVSWGSITMD